MTDKTPDSYSLMTFPCDFTFKIFGLSNDEFEGAVLTIIHKNAPDFSDKIIESRSSKKGKYIALSITIRATSQQQLDTIYKELSSHPQIMIVL